MKEQFVKLSDVKDVLEEAGLVIEYYDGGYESVSGYNVDDVNDGLSNLPVYEFEVPDETIEDKQAAVNGFVDDLLEKLFERESRYDNDDNCMR